MSASLQPLPIARPPLRRGWVLAACMLAMFMTAIEATIIATAMPTIAGELHGFAWLSGVFAIYLITQAISVPLYGRLADLIGRRRVFFFGITLFLIGSILCGLATSMPMLVLFRALQGLGAGAISPVASTIIGDIYDAGERAKMQGYLGSVWGGSAIVGPLLGAFIVEHAGWPLIFWLNLPVGLIAMFILARYFPEPERARSQQQLDWRGVLWLIVATGLLLGSLLQAESLGIWTWPLLALAVAIGVLWHRQQQRSPGPLFPPVLWRSPLIVIGSLGGLIVGAAMMGLSAYLPTFLQAVGGHTPLQAGITLAVMSIGWPLASAGAGWLMLRTSFRTTAVLGSVLLLTGTAILPLLAGNAELATARLGAFVVGAGMGMTTTTFLLAVQSATTRELRGIATASTLFSRMLGSALGTAVLGAILSLGLTRLLPEQADPFAMLTDPQTRAAQSADTLAHLLQATASALHLVFWAGVVLAFLALLLALRMPARVGPTDIPSDMLARPAPASAP